VKYENKRIIQVYHKKRETKCMYREEDCEICWLYFFVSHAFLCDN